MLTLLRSQLKIELINSSTTSSLRFRCCFGKSLYRSGLVGLLFI